MNDTPKVISPIWSGAILLLQIYKAQGKHSVSSYTKTLRKIGYSSELNSMVLLFEQTQSTYLITIYLLVNNPLAGSHLDLLRVKGEFQRKMLSHHMT